MVDATTTLIAILFLTVQLAAFYPLGGAVDVATGAIGTRPKGRGLARRQLSHQHRGARRKYEEAPGTGADPQRQARGDERGGSSSIMKVLVTSEHRFYRAADGRVWTETQCPYSFWRRYLEVFDDVEVLARVQSVDAPADGWREASGPHVSFIDVPYYIGPVEYLKVKHAVRRAIDVAVRQSEATLLRIPSQLGGLAAATLRRLGRPYGVEVVGDPYEVFSAGGSRHPLRLLWRWHFSRVQRRLCQEACGAAYVTERTLQQRYPCRGLQIGISDVELGGQAAPAHVTHYSSVDLKDFDFVFGARPPSAPLLVARLVVVGSLAQPYKGVDVLLRAAAGCIAAGRPVELVVVGDGRYRPEMEQLSSELGLHGRVTFTGNVPAGAAVRTFLDAADLFVLPSRTEGLPRAVIEAMARALPCVASDVGGIPELLPPEDLVPPGDVAALTSTLLTVLADPGRLAAMSARNLEKAREFHHDVLSAKRCGFYRDLQANIEAFRARTQDVLHEATA